MQPEGCLYGFSPPYMKYINFRLQRVNTGWEFVLFVISRILILGYSMNLHLMVISRVLLYETSPLTRETSVYCQRSSHMFMTVFSGIKDYFPQVYEPIMLCNCNKLYFLCDKKWILNNINRFYLKFILILPYFYS